MQGGERRPLHLQAGVDGCGMSHRSLLQRGTPTLRSLTRTLKAYYTFVMKQDHRRALALIYIRVFLLKTFTFKSIPLDGNRYLFSQMGGNFLAPMQHIFPVHKYLKI